MNKNDLVNLRTEKNRVASIAQVAVSQYGGGDRYNAYLSAFAEALEYEPPPFDTENYSLMYHSSALDPRWLATSILTNAEMEGDGARRLWSLASFTADAEERALLKRHAVDESKHSLLYLALLDLAFPNAITPEFRRELKQLSPGFGMHKELYPIEGSPYARAPTIDDYLQMNIAEIRTTVHHLMQRHVIRAHCPEENLPQVMQVMESLLDDELAHVGYTAMLIDRNAKRIAGDRVSSLLRKRLRDFNAITTEELGQSAFGCSAGCCEKRDWCRAGPSASPYTYRDAPTLD
ncbi:hypothetical protein ACC713_35025 [Rhizobium johnstonii]|uniref:hypothetical protein n=1 Tax=Rhizobium TaxID=379 RepID=UPI001031327B|nr:MULTISPECIES: hypothetical protein [Rhizobium]TBB57979.1 hypothetical protein ELH43_40340 [Rhizobium ruizarguesonis]TBF43782.1 hypothetical protein ELG90_36375 [Rhizobium leguminosarum]TBF85871.1 hypothetical protein ELG85_36755 [Rhizobium leguminosarum]TBG09964.1 hypothetical protein ELG79_34700 [Rhizobium leguminosarum]TBG35895.1 hypothetical protein ELG78_02315 [Rhizobium leguminosarum]